MPIKEDEEMLLCHPSMVRGWNWQACCRISILDRVRTGDVDAGIARAFSFVGPGLPTDLHYAVGNFIASAVQGKDISIKVTEVQSDLT